MCAEYDRLDENLINAMMLGKFKFTILYNVGHYMQEDDYIETARAFNDFVRQFRLPINT